MTWQEWLEVVGWIEKQWPSGQPWPAETVKAAYEMIRLSDGADVWAAANQWFIDGHHWPPVPAELASSTKQIARDRLSYRPETAAPTKAALGNPDPPVGLRTFLDLRGFATFDDAVMAWRAKNGLEAASD